MIKYVTGDLLQSPAQTLVNPVNTVGAMGKGLALVFNSVAGKKSPTSKAEPKVAG